MAEPALRKCERINSPLGPKGRFHKAERLKEF